MPGRREMYSATPAGLPDIWQPMRLEGSNLDHNACYQTCLECGRPGRHVRCSLPYGRTRATPCMARPRWTPLAGPSLGAIDRRQSGPAVRPGSCGRVWRDLAGAIGPQPSHQAVICHALPATQMGQAQLNLGRLRPSRSAQRVNWPTTWPGSSSTAN